MVRLTGDVNGKRRWGNASFPAGGPAGDWMRAGSTSNVVVVVARSERVVAGVMGVGVRGGEGRDGDGGGEERERDHNRQGKEHDAQFLFRTATVATGNGQQRAHSEENRKACSRASE